ncbi:hypothetical protein PV04_00755 [Phialophora macrospora]|uniref:Uncharacterized protein n=1 Tax=Phialophora macrospora TaxID=1851006 RepID=A0A0D2FVU2_9EURO|nr:hypothetical protein PV04_00755 [Phialophora macrospora]
MCVTEVWSYRECGCFYNQSVLCRFSQNQPSPFFAPNIQHPLRRWLQETGVNTQMAFEQSGVRARPTKPPDCANHRTVQKSFLNQICDDCLLTELEARTDPSCNGDNAYETSVTTPETGEGLIWDSEVKIEIEGQNMVSPRRAVVQNTPQPVIEPRDDDKEIFESQVEITVEYEDHSVFEEELSSPSCTATQRNCCSWIASVGASAPRACHAGVYESGPASYQNKRHRRDLQNKLSELDDADDEFEYAAPFSGNPPQTNRGRPLTRSNLHKVESCDPDASAPVDSVSERAAGRNRSRFPGLRSLSTTFLSSTRVEQGRTDENSRIYITSNSSSPESRSKNPFRAIRNRKSSPLIREPSSFGFPASENLPINQGSDRILNSEAQKSRPVLPRKSTLRGFRLFQARDLKGIQAVCPPSEGTSRSLVQSSTSMGEDSDSDGEITTFSETQKSDSHSETVFETNSRVTSLQSEAMPPKSVDGEASDWRVISSIPKSSTMNTLRAVINDLSLGLAVQDSFPSQGSISPQCRIADVAELGQMDTPELLMHQEQLHDHQHVEHSTVCPSRLTSSDQPCRSISTQTRRHINSDQHQL